LILFGLTDPALVTAPCLIQTLSNLATPPEMTHKKPKSTAPSLIESQGKRGRECFEWRFVERFPHRRQCRHLRGKPVDQCHITNFPTAIDRISPAKAIFTGLGAVGRLGSTAFYATAGATSGHLATDRVIFNTTTGDVYYDADGSASGSAVQIAVLDGHSALAYTDVPMF